ncbi:MAG: hypothetical protein ACW972_08905 [Promethearchaeota archaeon]|jgi:hypothetical protein
MSVDTDQKNMLMEMIEQVLLNEEDLDSLKTLINGVSSGTKNPKQLKIAIIKSRVEALKRILDIFPFFHKRILNQHEIEKFTSEYNNDLKLHLEIEEKNTFLEQIGIRLNKILDKLMV